MAYELTKNLPAYGMPIPNEIGDRPERLPMGGFPGGPGPGGPGGPGGEVHGGDGIRLQFRKRLPFFFPQLFGCYVAMLALSYVQEKRRLFLLLAGLLFLTNSVLLFCEKLFCLGVSAAWKWPLGPEYVLFVMLGYVLGKSEFGWRVRWLIYLLGLVGFGLHYFGTWWLSPVGGPINMLFKGYMNWPSVLYSAAVFVAVKNISWSGCYALRPLAWLLDKLKSASLSIYLLHGFLVYWLFPKTLPKFLGCEYGSLFAYRLFAPLAIVATCVAIHYLLSRIPVVRHVLGGK